MSTQVSTERPGEATSGGELPLLPLLSEAFIRSMDGWTARVIARAKRGIRSGAVRWVWSLPYWYRHGGDAWVDEVWWTDAAREALAADAMDTHALEVLLENEADNYRDNALAAVEAWQARGGFNPERWDGILAHFYPEHAVARGHFESRISYTTIGAAARCFRVGFQPARDDLRQAYVDYRGRKELPVLADALLPLGRELLQRVLSAPELDRVRLDCLEICGQDPSWAEVHAGQSAALRWAEAMAWSEIPARLQENAGYPQALLFGPSGRSRLSLNDDQAGADRDRSPRDAIIHALREHVAQLPRGERRAPSAPCRLSWGWRDVDLLLWSLALPGDHCAQLAAAATSLSKLCRGVDFHYRLLLAITWTRVRAPVRASAGA